VKNILIWGVPRSGKSTLANMIRKEYGHSIIQLDAIKRVYDVLRPEDEIYAQDTTNLREAKLMAKMVTRLIQCLSWGNDRGEYYIYEGVSFDMDNIISALPKELFPVSTDRFLIICMGYANISPEEMVETALRYETINDWTYNESMESKLMHFKAYCNESKYIRSTAERLKLDYFDVSYDRSRILEEIIQYVKAHMSIDEETVM
jgi:adenylate kinase family enzyme